jgi:hypothetical protein
VRTRASFGVMVAHFTPAGVTLRCAPRIVRVLVVGFVAIFDGTVIILKANVQKWQDQFNFDNPQMMRVISSRSSSTTGFLL